MKKFKTKPAIYLIPMLVVFLTIVITYYKHYESTVDIIKSSYDSNISLIEQSIYNEIKYTEMIGSIFEGDIRDEMEENTQILMEKYKENPSVLEWDFEEMKKQVNNMDIHILDKELKIVASSIQKEIGLDFSIFIDFSEILKGRLVGNQFESDPLNFSILEGELVKYSFMPTPDNEYLIELGVSIQDVYPQLRDLNIVYLTDNLKEDYPFVENMRVYKFNQNRQYSHELDRAGKEPNIYTSVTREQDKYVKKALKTARIQQVIRQGDHGNTYTVKYIPYTVQQDEEGIAWWKSYVIEITYNDELIIEEIKNQKNMFFQNIIIISSLYFGLGFMIVFLITKNQKTANQDYLTKLPNRKRFEEVMSFKIASATRKNTKIAILFFDLDDFKAINDTYGHGIGDKVLKQVGKIIKGGIPKGDMISRLGGDEFAGIISGISDQEEISEIGERMIAQFNDTFKIDSKEIWIKPSMGISVYPDHGETVEELILKADKAMYKAKENKLRYCVYKD